MQQKHEQRNEPAARKPCRKIRLTGLCRKSLAAIFRRDDMTVEDWRRIEFKKSRVSEHGIFGGSL